MDSNLLHHSFRWLLICTLAFAACEAPPPEQTETPPPPKLNVEVAKPILKEIIEWDEYTGRFEATERVEVRARVSGYVEAVKFRDGQMVRKGQPLFVIDQRPFQISLQQNKAGLERAKAEFRQAQSNFNRVKSLKDSRAISQEEYDQREQLMVAAEAGVAAAEAQVSRAELDLEFTTVLAPISGRVSRDLVNPGNLITGGDANGTLLTTIVSLDPIHFYFEGSEADLLKYIRLDRTGSRKGSREQANPVLARLLDEEEYVHEGKMDFVDNEVDFGTGTIQGRAIFKNPDYVIESGMFGRARLLGSGKYEAILIPDQIIGTDQSKKFVYVLDENNKIAMRNVELGPLHEQSLRIVRKGLQANDQIVLNNIQKIFPGMEINPVDGTISTQLN
ncbi:MAG: efflux RND transporter periplasmic adaptor subunit [Bacteroidota bacterium]